MSTSVFLSWSHENAKLKTDLLRRLEPRLSNLRDVDVLWWEDSNIRVGEQFRSDIVARLSECDFVLALLSQELFASEFIRTVELPPVTSGVKPVIPVALGDLALDGTFDWRGIEHRQIFALDGHAYSALRAHRCDEFATQLAAKIRERILDLPRWRAL